MVSLEQGLLQEDAVQIDTTVRTDQGNLIITSRRDTDGTLLGFYAKLLGDFPIELHYSPEYGVEFTGYEDGILETREKAVIKALKQAKKSERIFEDDIAEAFSGYDDRYNLLFHTPEPAEPATATVTERIAGALADLAERKAELGAATVSVASLYPFVQYYRSMGCDLEHLSAGMEATFLGVLALIGIKSAQGVRDYFSERQTGQYQPQPVLR